MIFESFIQEEFLNTRGYEGSGLGLSISQGLVALLGGSIHADSEKGIGSRFSFTIPYKAADSCELPSDNRVLKEHLLPGKPVILIADDDRYNFILIETILKRSDITVYAAENGQEAVDFCHEHPEISLVLMDMKMPVMDGLEATREIKAFRKDLPVIAITAFAMSGDEERILASGCDDYVPKPVSRDQLSTKLSKFGIMV